MRIDRTHRSWSISTLIAFAAALCVYVFYAMRSPSAPRGGSALGLTYGILGYALMLFAGLLGARKKVPIWRIGRAQTWMRGHLWLGLLSLPLILFHSGFAFRGPLTTLLMLLLFAVIASGVAGALFQHYLPLIITARAPLETIYEEIPSVRAQLCEEADQLVAALAESEHEDKVRFRDLYSLRIRPFLARPENPSEILAGPERAAGLFQSFRAIMPASFHPVLDDLENICEEERQLTRQARLYRWLHAWLLIHVPLSIVLLVLGAVHAIMALRY